MALLEITEWLLIWQFKNNDDSHLSQPWFRIYGLGFKYRLDNAIEVST